MVLKHSKDQEHWSGCQTSPLWRWEQNAAPRGARCVCVCGKNPNFTSEYAQKWFFGLLEEFLLLFKAAFAFRGYPTARIPSEAQSPPAADAAPQAMKCWSLSRSTALPRVQAAPQPARSSPRVVYSPTSCGASPCVYRTRCCFWLKSKAFTGALKAL